MSESEITILFDARCPTCRLLASVLAADSPPHWNYRSWQEFARSAEAGPPSMRLSPLSPPELSLAVGERWLEGEAAWQYLVESEPRLRMWQKMASKVGIAPPLSARLLRRIGRGVRRFCGDCRAR